MLLSTVPKAREATEEETSVLRSLSALVLMLIVFRCPLSDGCPNRIESVGIIQGPMGSEEVKPFEYLEMILNTDM